MRRPILLAVTAAALLALPSTAGAQPPSGHVQLRLVHTLGQPAVGLRHRHLAVLGRVWPYVGGLRVRVAFAIDGHRAGSATATVRALGDGSGAFQVAYRPPRAGVLRITASHRASGEIGDFTARPLKLRVLDPDFGVGARGPAVRTLQRDLARLHYAIHQSGVFDSATSDAVIAYRKLTFLPLVDGSDMHLFLRLLRGAGSFHVRYPRDGRHVEADLSRQVLAEIDPGGRVRLIYTMSSGKPSTPTVVGRFRVYYKTPGINEKGMVDSSYFIRGYAIHGYVDVPTYAASHGCLRIPIPDAAAVYQWATMGTPVDVYTGDGTRGSHRVNANAGP